MTSRPFSKQVTPRVPGARTALRRLVATQNPHFRFYDLDHHGYLVVEVTAEHVRTEFWHVDTVTERAPGERLVTEWLVRDGETRLSPGRLSGPAGGGASRRSR